VFGGGTARNVRLGHRKSEQIREWERYGLCARCGSQSIATVKAKGFVPTALAQATPPSNGPAPVGQSSAAPPPGQPAPDASGSGLQPGARVTVDQLGMRGKHGRVEAVRLDGTLDVRLDGSNLLVKRIPARNLTRYHPTHRVGEEQNPPPPAAGFRPGDRVTVQVLGFRGKTGLVELVRSDGSYDVRLDDPSILVKRVPAAKLTPAAS
jgi:hypothetical protein